MAPNNALQVYGNEKTMNLNHLILTNIQASPYFKVQLFELKTYHEVIDEIYYKVSHLEPWEKGSRKTAGQTGMCGGVRGVGAGGIVSSAYCLLYKLCTLKLTRKQVNGLCTHPDSPYIRGLGFMYIRYTQPPGDLWEWYEPYLDDEEEMDVKAGGGHVMSVGEMLRQWLTKLEWYSTLFPRIPVPVQKQIEINMRNRYGSNPPPSKSAEHIPDEDVSFGEAGKYSHSGGNASQENSPREHRRPSPPFQTDRRKRSRSRERRSRSRDRYSGNRDRRSHDRRSRDRDRDRKQRDYDRHRGRSRSREHSDSRHDRKRSRSHDRSKKKTKSHERKRSHSRERKRSRERVHSSERHHKKSKHKSKDKDRESSFERDLRREKVRQNHRYDD